MVILKCTHETNKGERTHEQQIVYILVRLNYYTSGYTNVGSN